MCHHNILLEERYVTYIVDRVLHALLVQGDGAGGGLAEHHDVVVLLGDRRGAGRDRRDAFGGHRATVVAVRGGRHQLEDALKFEQ